MNFPAIQNNQQLQQAVDAKELYQALGLDTTQWARWSKQNIQDNPFALQGTDYGVYDSMANTQGGRPTTNYLLAIDFAKKLAMQVRTEKGEQVRNYFLECERKAQQSVVALPNDYLSALKALIESEEAKQQACLQIEQLQPKAAALDAISYSTGSLGIREASKALGINQNAFVSWGLQNQARSKPASRVFFYRGGDGVLNAYQHQIDKGFLSQRIELVIDRAGKERLVTRVKITPQGLTHMANMIATEKQNLGEWQGDSNESA